MNTRAATHEDLSREERIIGPSDRAFGFTFAVVFVLVAVLPLLRGDPPRLSMIAGGLTFFALALARPRLLAPFNRVWLRVGLLLHRIVNPIVMGLIFFLVVTPIGVLMRLLRGDRLGRKPDGSATTYWIERVERVDATDLRNQF